MNNRKLHHYYTIIRPIRSWYLLVVALVFAALAVHGLRENYSKMADLREAVYVADRQNGDVEAALAKLREHVHAHMNTNLSSGNNAIKPPIQLKARYERLVKTESERVKQLNRQVTARGEQICAQRFPATGYNAPRVDCIQKNFAANAVQEKSIPDSLYKFDFISPRWSPDLAGISILFSAFFFTLFLTRWLAGIYIRRRLE